MVQKERGKWYIKGRVKTPDGVKHYHRVAQDCRLRKEAEAYEEAYRKRLLVDRIVVNAPTMEQAAHEMLKDEEEHGRKLSTLQTYRYQLSKMPEWLKSEKIDRVSVDRLQYFIRQAEKKHSPNYVSSFYYFLRKLFKFAIYKGYISFNPMDRVRRAIDKSEIRKEIQIWEPEQFASFLQFEAGRDTPDKVKAFWIFSYWMGTRKGETCAIQWQDVDFKRGSVRINKTVVPVHNTERSWKLTTPKSKNSDRVISMPEVVVTTLKALHTVAMRTWGYDGTAFVFGYENPIAIDRPRKLLVKEVAAYNEAHEVPLPLIRIHDFRHSHASYLINNMSDKYTVYDVAKRLGDTVDTVLDTYAHWFKDADKKVVAVIDHLSAPRPQTSAMGVDDLRGLYELLQIGAITRAEYDAKKQQILGV